MDEFFSGLAQSLGLVSRNGGGGGNSGQLGLGVGGGNLAQVPQWLRRNFDEARSMPQGGDAGTAEAEANHAGVMAGRAVVFQSIAKSRGQQLRALGKMATAQIRLDSTAHSVSTQIVQAQAQAIAGINREEFGNRITGAHLNGEVSTLKGENCVFNL